MTPKRMVKILRSKLSKDEVFELWNLIDIDEETTAGPFWKALAEAAFLARPEEFVHIGRNPTNGLLVTRRDG